MALDPERADRARRHRPVVDRSEAARRRRQHELALDVLAFEILRGPLADVDQVAGDVGVGVGRRDRFRDVMEVVNLLGPRRGDPELAHYRLPGLSGREVFDLDVGETVFRGQPGHRLALAEVPLVFRRRPHELVRHLIQHVVQRALAGGLVDDRVHLLLRQERAVLFFLGDRGHAGTAIAAIKTALRMNPPSISVTDFIPTRARVW